MGYLLPGSFSRISRTCEWKSSFYLDKALIIIIIIIVICCTLFIQTKRRFLEGTLHPANVLMCPHTCVTNLPKPREIHSDVGPASVMVGNIVQGNRLASAQGRECDK